MASSRRVWVKALVVALLVLSGCYPLVYRPRDIANARRQFRIPRAVSFQSFESYPRTSGFFGREGLRITGTARFSESQFRAYVAHLDDENVWEPVAYRDYSPSIGETYSAEALRWNALPIPDSLAQWFDQIGFEPDGLGLQDGVYYCSVILTVRGQPLEHNPAAYRWHPVGRSCSELSESEHPTILAFAVLDYEQRLIHVHIQFSG